MRFARLASAVRVVASHPLSRWAGKVVAVVGSFLTVCAIFQVCFAFGWPLLVMACSFLVAHWVATSVVVATVGIAFAAACSDTGAAYCAEWNPTENHAMPNSVHHLCSGSQFSSLYSESDCVRIDPYDGCARIERCLSVGGRDYFVDPYPKLGPCSDVLDEMGKVRVESFDQRCVSIDHSFDCYRPTRCP